MSAENDSAGSMGIAMRVYYSEYHYWSAQHFAAIVRRIEENAGEGSGFDIQHRAFVTNTIFASVAFLESAINEIFQDAKDASAYLKSLDSKGVVSLSDVSNDNVPFHVKALDTISVALQFAEEWESKSRFPAIKKYNLALKIADKPLFERDRDPCQSVDLLIQLRNQLIHFNPETLGSDKLRPLDELLYDQFPLNKMVTAPGNPFFPDKCLGYGCCKWAVSSSKLFVDEFFTRMGLDSRYQKSDWTDPELSVDELSKSLQIISTRR